MDRVQVIGVAFLLFAGFLWFILVQVPRERAAKEKAANEKEAAEWAATRKAAASSPSVEGSPPKGTSPDTPDLDAFEIERAKRRIESHPDYGMLTAGLDNFGGTGLSGSAVADIVANVVGRRKAAEAVHASQQAQATKTFETAGRGVQTILCSDNECPCTDKKQLTLGKDAYLFISQGVVEFRKDCLTLTELELKVSALKSPTKMIEAATRSMPIYVCEMGARRRRLDLACALDDGVAAATGGFVPLRPTPNAG